ncbi:hypothetical protein PYCCODRAFT_1426950 [Trametes coccinea BRFM310]|uniref:Uncharacterized protein n=1 Tax=Trametes coccinea (strain BRFM310) TaxID=1353009 RepID=A0A1Y2IFB8_TRAC3|nr:hypothetical protein PYCCODRAFT_1426950 [Trametes coccinea BRFM310]
MPRSRHSRHTRYNNSQYQRPAHQNQPPAHQQNPVLHLEIPGLLVPNLTTILNQSPTYDHLPRLPMSSFGNGTFADKVSWTLVHLDLCCTVNQLLGLRAPGLSVWVDVYRSAANIIPALQLMRTFALAHPGTDHDFHQEVRATLDTALIHDHQLADLSLRKDPYTLTAQPNPANDGPGRVDCYPGVLRHCNVQAWNILISPQAPFASPNTANQQWGMPSKNSARWRVSPTPWDGLDDKASNDSNKEDRRPNTPYPHVQAPPTTPTPSLPELQYEEDDKDSVSEEACQHLIDFLTGRTRDMTLTTLINPSPLHILAAATALENPNIPYIDDVLVTINPNGLHLDSP